MKLLEADRERHGTSEVRFVFEGLVADSGEWKSQIEGLLMGGKVVDISVESRKRVRLESN